MRAWNRLAMGAVACALSLALACSGKTTGGDGDGGGGSSGGGSSACDDYFNAAFSGACPRNNLAPAPSEIARVQSRFDKLCADALALPGVGITSASLEACVAAIQSTSCAVLDDQYGACSFTSGSLAAGASCLTDAQCGTGDCSAGVQAPDGGITVCGVCSAAVPLGGSCANGQSCGPNAMCNFGAMADETCVAVVSVGEGGACNSAFDRCNSGLQCNSSGVCAVPEGPGAACRSDWDCAPPLACPAPAAGPSTCQPEGAVGAPCYDAAECTSGLHCDLTSYQCTSVTWVAAGQPCNGGSLSCLVGGCSMASPEGTETGTCPTVIPDGQPCNPTDGTTTCDTFAQCTQGVCVLGYATCP